MVFIARGLVKAVVVGVCVASSCAVLLMVTLVEEFIHHVGGGFEVGFPHMINSFDFPQPYIEVGNLTDTGRVSTLLMSPSDMLCMNVSRSFLLSEWYSIPLRMML